MTVDERKEYTVQWLKEQLVWDMFSDNLITDCKLNHKPLHEFWNKLLSDSPYSVISNAFVWRHTPEGHRFWDDIATRFSHNFK